MDYYEEQAYRLYRWLDIRGVHISRDDAFQGLKHMWCTGFNCLRCPVTTCVQTYEGIIS
jgi:hypothetical protein